MTASGPASVACSVVSGGGGRPRRPSPVAAVVVVLALLSGCARTTADHSGAARRRTAPTPSVGSTTTSIPPQTPPPPTTEPPGSARTPNDLVRASRLSQLPAYRDVPWADDLKAEQDALDGLQHTGPQPYGEYVVPDFEGRYTHVRNGERRTLQLACAGCPTRVVWLMGASSAFGLGQRDDYTTASYLVKEAHAHGVHLIVRNLAVPGHTIWDEAKGLVAHLRIDRGRPDAVLFFDGFNDALASYMYAAVRGGRTMTPIRFGDSWIDEFLAAVHPPTVDDATVRRLAVHVADQYRATQRSIRGVLRPRGIRSVFFLQPDGFVSPLQLQGLERSLNTLMADLAKRNVVGDLLAQVAADLGHSVHDLRAPMARYDRPVFADTTHFNEEGARVIARWIWAVLAPMLR